MYKTQKMSKTAFTDYYSLLEIPVESDTKVINKAYRKKAFQYHPDKNKGSNEASICAGYEHNK